MDNIYNILSIIAVAAAFPFLGMAIICSFNKDKDKKEGRSFEEKN